MNQRILIRARDVYVRFFIDVVFGAALGESVGWAVVGRHGRDRYVLRAFSMTGGGMIAITNN